MFNWRRRFTWLRNRQHSFLGRTKDAVADYLELLTHFIADRMVITQRKGIGPCCHLAAKIMSLAGLVVALDVSGVVAFKISLLQDEHVLCPEETQNLTLCHQDGRVRRFSKDFQPSVSLFPGEELIHRLFKRIRSRST